jgi:hypothetical protein
MWQPERCPSTQWQWAVTMVDEANPLKKICSKLSSSEHTIDRSMFAANPKCAHWLLDMSR